MLAALLAHPATTVHTLERAAQIYDAVRRPVAQRVAALSREAGLLYTLNFPGLNLEGGGSKEETLQQIYARLRGNWEWAWETSALPDVERAGAILEGRGA